MKNSTIYFAFLFLFLISSCEKGMDSIEYQSSVYIPNSGLSTYAVLLGESTFELGIYKAGINQQNGNVDVQLKVDTDAFNEYLSTHPGFQLLPEQYYNIESTSINIPSDSECEPLKIELKGVDESFVNTKYILPIAIESVSGDINILEEKCTALLNFNRFRNVYETLYKAKGFVVEAGSEAATSLIDKEVTSISVSANSIKINSLNNNLDLVLTIEGEKVTISGASGFNNYNIQNTEGKTSTYTGEFDPEQQANRGTFNLYYSFTTGGKQMNVETELQFWL